MSVQQPIVTVSKKKGLDKTLRKMYINYMQMMIDCAKDQEFRDKLFSDNKMRVEYLNKKVGMNIPESTHVIFQTKSDQAIGIYVKGDEGEVYFHESSDSLSAIEKLKSGEIKKESMTLKSQKEVDINITNVLHNCEVVLILPFIDPNSDFMLFELKYDDTEIIFSTCVI